MGFIPRPPEGTVSPFVLVALEWWIGTGRDAFLRFVRDCGHHLIPDAVRVLTPSALEIDLGDGRNGECEMYLVVRLHEGTDLHALYATHRERREGYKCPHVEIIPEEIAHGDLTSILEWETAAMLAEYDDADL